MPFSQDSANRGDLACAGEAEGFGPLQANKVSQQVSDNVRGLSLCPALCRTSAHNQTAEASQISGKMPLVLIPNLETYQRRNSGGNCSQLTKVREDKATTIRIIQCIGSQSDKRVYSSASKTLEEPGTTAFIKCLPLLSSLY